MCCCERRTTCYRSIFQPGKVSYHAYPVRWYILFVFSALAFHQAFVWNTFGPIAFAVQRGYDWSDGTVATMLNWGPISFLIFLFPMSYLIETNGLRRVVLLNAVIVLVGTTLRTFTTDETAFLVLAHIGSMINGAAGIAVMSLPPLIAGVWFPEKERIFATSLSQVQMILVVICESVIHIFLIFQAANIIGVAVNFLVAPLLVPFDESYSEEDDIPADVIDETRKNIMIYMIIEAAIAAAIVLLVIIYFPDRPRTPPSASSEREKLNFFNGWSGVLKNKNLWIMCAAYALPGGVQVGWQGVMALNFEHLGTTDTEIGDIGFVSIFTQAATAVAVAFMQDRFRDKIKMTLLLLLLLSSLCFTWLALLSFEVITYSLAQLYVATVLGVSAYYACLPLFFEFAIMIAHPTPDGLVGCYLTGVYNLVGFLFYMVLLIPDIGALWMNYALVVVTVLSIPLLALVKKPKDFVAKM